jgi:hypothetical protein
MNNPKLLAKVSQAQAITPGTAEVVAIGATSAQSAAYAAETLVRVLATVACHILIGTNPTALTTSTPLLANSIEYYIIPAGSKLAVIRDSGDGSLYLTPAV